MMLIRQRIWLEGPLALRNTFCRQGQHSCTGRYSYSSIVNCSTTLRPQEAMLSRRCEIWDLQLHMNRWVAMMDVMFATELSHLVVSNLETVSHVREILEREYKSNTKMTQSTVPMKFGENWLDVLIWVRSCNLGSNILVIFMVTVWWITSSKDAKIYVPSLHDVG